MKILVQVTVQDAIGVTPITHFVTIETEFQHTAASAAAKAATSLVTETVGEFVEWQEEVLDAAKNAFPARPQAPVRAGDRAPIVADDPEAWDALAFLTRTPEAIHDAVAEEGGD